jgi:hypothetical protein
MQLLSPSPIRGKWGSTFSLIIMMHGHLKRRIDSRRHSALFAILSMSRAEESVTALTGVLEKGERQWNSYLFLIRLCRQPVRRGGILSGLW